MSLFEKMPLVNPVRFEVRMPAGYRVTWSVDHVKGHTAIGEGPSPYHALAEAFKDAVNNGWAKY